MRWDCLGRDKPFPLFALTLLFVVCSSSPLMAADTLFLSLQEMVEMSVKNSVDLEIERENLNLRGADIQRERAGFDPSFYLDARTDRAVRGSTSLIEAGVTSGANLIINENQKISTGLKQRFGWGGNYELSVGEVRSLSTLQSVNPTFHANTIITVTQPLLKGFGREVAQGPLHVARNQFWMAQIGLRSLVMGIIQEASDAYWDMVFGLENLAIQQQALKSAQQLLEVNRKKVVLGLLAPIEILVAEFGVASRQEEVIVAQKGVEDAEDHLKRLLNLTDKTIHPKDRPIEIPINMEEETLVSLAMTQRPEIEQNRLELQNRELLRRMADNQRSLSLDLVGSVGRNGLGKNRHDELDRILSGDLYQWEAGIVLSYPIGNRAALAHLKREESELNKVRLAQKKMTQQITQETKEGLRRVKTDFQRIATTRGARLLSERKLVAGMERFQLGLISSHDLLEFQDELASVKGKELKAMIDYNKSLVRLNRITGTLLHLYPMEGAVNH